MTFENKYVEIVKHILMNNKGLKKLKTPNLILE